ncbi:MAG: MFS transporter, partial [Actinomycetes bacterium]
NEAAGYLGVAGTALATGYIASTFGLRPGPFLLGAAFIAIGLGLSVLAVRETHHHVKAEAAHHISSHAGTH